MNTWSPPETKRMIIPDVARGLALLGIALANASLMWFSYNIEDTAGPLGGINNNSALDTLTAVVTALIAHNRGLPMFSTLLGFGVGLIVASLWRKGFTLSQARKTIARRYGFLLLFGLIHLIFIFPGDIMFYYGVSALILTTMIAAKNKTLTIIAWVLLGFNFLGGFIMSMFMLTLTPSMAMDSAREMATVSTATSYGEFLGDNLSYFGLSILNFPVYFFGYLPLMIIGFLWARNGVLSDVDKHRTLLITWCAVGVVVALFFGGVWAYQAVVEQSMVNSLFTMMLNQFFGVLTGPGILAGLALLLNSVQKKIDAGATAPLWVAVPSALGKRSMSGYAMQSILFGVLSYRFLGGFGHFDGAFLIAVYATVIWLITLGLAWLLEKKNIQGPFEWVHRRLSYGPTMKPELKAPRKQPAPSLAPGPAYPGLGAQQPTAPTPQPQRTQTLPPSIPPQMNRPSTQPAPQPAQLGDNPYQLQQPPAAQEPPQTSQSLPASDENPYALRRPNEGKNPDVPSNPYGW